MNQKKLPALFAQYDKARAEASEAKKAQEDLSKEIKAILGETTATETPDYTCKYEYEKDKEVFDAAKFEAKEPAKFAAYQALQDDMEKLTKKYTKTVPGARKLIITRKNDGEE
jgi:hypothetical protein